MKSIQPKINSKNSFICFADEKFWANLHEATVKSDKVQWIFM